jgi:hypothetical protein
MKSDYSDLGLFDNSVHWQWAPPEICKREGVFPNLLTYSEEKKVLPLIVTQSNKREDFAVGEAGLQYLEAAQKKACGWTANQFNTLSLC